MPFAPIALFVYSRPEHTKRTVEALKLCELASESELHIFSDAPRSSAALRAVEDVRGYIATISGFKSVNVYCRESNAGLARSVIEGVTKLCSAYGRAIVLEDDLIPSKGFLKFMNDGLERYAHEDNIMQISGYMFPSTCLIDCDSLFLPFITSWGWATWDRAWRNFDSKAKQYTTLKASKPLRKRFDLNGNYPYFKILTAQRSGKVDSWAIRWYLSVFMRGGLVLFPRRSLVYNDGFDGSGVNCAVSKLDQDGLDSSFRVVTFPESIETSVFADEVMDKMPRPQRSIRSVFARLTKITFRH